MKWKKLEWKFTSIVGQGECHVYRCFHWEKGPKHFLNHLLSEIQIRQKILMSTLLCIFVEASRQSMILMVEDLFSQILMKDLEHQTRVTKACVNIKLPASMKAHADKEMFLLNIAKSQFILLLNYYWIIWLPHRSYFTGDADTMIVDCALEIANNGMEVNISDDTDVLILLMHHWKEAMGDV